MTITVTQLGNFLKALVDSEVLLLDLNVEGEISTFRQSGEVAFFVLKDSGAQIDCFYYNPPRLDITDGQKVVVSGKPNYYLRGGKLSFAVKKIEKKDEKGESYKQFMLLKERLEKEGIFDPLKKKPIVSGGRKLGVVTSAGGAVIHDILTVSRRRNPSVDIILYGAKVQGVGSAESIVRGIKYLDNTDVDNIIIGRGGGSDEDLSVFNDERVIYAVAACKKPTVSAVGHETDFTLCDFAADARAATPSQAAELCTSDIRGALDDLSVRLGSCLRHGQNIVAQRKTYVLSATKIMMSRVKNLLDGATADVSASSEKLVNIMGKRVFDADKTLGLAAVRLDESNPAKILSKGYSVTVKDGKNVRSARQLREGDDIKIIFGDGQADAKVYRSEVKNEF